MGWNTVFLKETSKLHFNLQNNAQIKFYFAHSYYAICKNELNCAGYTNYSHDFCSIVEKDNIFGVQFHPEKSHYYGMELMKKFNNLK